MISAIVNARVVLEDKVLGNGTVVFQDGKILSIASGAACPLPPDAAVYDAGGLYAGPGYVDIHCHGGGHFAGHLEPARMARHHLRCGTTSLCVSLAYNLTPGEMFSGVERVRAAMADPDSSIAGIHLEGPYTNPKYGAAAKKAWTPDQKTYAALFDACGGAVRQVTYAPELPGMEDFEKFAAARGVALAVGHTEMSPAQLDRAVRHGAKIVTHLFDAMGCWRGNGSIAVTGLIQETAAEVALAREGLFYELICDGEGVHVKPANLRLTLRAAGPENIILITDAGTVSYDPGDFALEDPRSSPDLIYNAAGELSGSRLHMEDAVRNMKKHTGASVPELFRMAAGNPARAVGIDGRVGSLTPGRDANIILCDDVMRISQVFFRGSPVR